MGKLNNAETRIGEILNLLPEINDKHARSNNMYKLLNAILIENIDIVYQNNEQFTFGNFGTIYMPYISFGAINSKDLFGLDELMIFSYYMKMKNNYKVALDLGANIGLHSILMSKCFDNVISFEPDTFHTEIFNEIVKKNEITNIQLVEKAISSLDGQLEFTRLKGNTTGSHISGSKNYVYGEVEKFNVECTTLENAIVKYKPNFIKMDIEGQEKDVLLGTSIDMLKNIDMIIEVSSENSAEELFNYFKDSEMNLFSQKTNWQRVEIKEDMPFSYKDGSLFISSKDKMDW